MKVFKKVSLYILLTVILSACGGGTSNGGEGTEAGANGSNWDSSQWDNASWK